ncbi:MAG: hypothetical protein K2X77_08590 [Candidatus Obscuribacterales bacterium]|nr:hypothetical protein [Candidatus Obscuribacterales bacterium]
MDDTDNSTNTILAPHSEMDEVSAPSHALDAPHEPAEEAQTCSTETNNHVDQPKPYEWILHPTLDLLFVCGGLLWIVFPIHFFLLGGKNDSPFAQWMVVTAALGTVMLSQTHIVATLVRLYNDRETREKFSLYSYWAAIACATLALAGCIHPALAGIYCRIYLLIVSQHFTAQAYGFALLYCFKRGYRMSAFDKGVLSSLMRSTMMFAILRQCTYKEWSGDKFLGQTLPFWGPLPTWLEQVAALCIVVSAVVFTACLVRNFVSTKKLFPLPSLLLVLTAVIIFVLGPKITGVLWIYVPAFFHGSQYVIATTAYHLKERGLPEGLPPNQIASLLQTEETYRYLGFLLIAGLALFMGLPQMLAQFGFNLTTATAVIFTTAQFHHVLTDAAIWKMKDPKLRNLLVS